MKTCRISNCEKKMIAKRLCPMHYARLNRYNEVPLLAPNQKPNRGKGFLIDKDGYKQIRIKSKNGFIYRREHRVIMENILDRVLLPKEVVHHKNGIKTDNRIENLELKTFSQHTSDHRTYPLNLKLKALHLYKSGMAMTKIPEITGISYSCIYNFIKNRFPIRGIYNRNLNKKENRRNNGLT